METSEPRSTTDFIRDLLTLLLEREWIEEMRRCGRGCCDEWSMRCPTCDFCQESGHAEWCHVPKLINETQGYLLVEEELERQVA